MKNGNIGKFKKEYIPEEFDKHPDYVAPIALQPNAIVAYKLNTRIRDFWVLTVALNSCPTFNKAWNEIHHLQLQTLQTVYNFAETNNRIITYPVNQTHQLQLSFDNDFTFELNQLQLVYQEVDINQLKYYHLPVYTNKIRFWIDPKKELFNTNYGEMYYCNDYINVLLYT